MINNKELIVNNLLKFENEGDFYALYIFKRKKDQPEGEKDNHQSVRTIKVYYIESIEYLEKRWDEIVFLCEYFKARAYIHVQKQNHKDVGLEMMVELATLLKDGKSKFNHLFDSVVGKIKTYSKLWVIDIDSKDENYDREIQKIIHNCRPEGSKIVINNPTKSGTHLITTPFDVKQFNDYCKKWKVIIPEIQKKNPTLLYYPNSLNI